MPVHRWHHVLKGKFLEGRRNRRLDHLLFVLVRKVLPYYLLKQRRQTLGFEGVDLEVAKRKAIIAQSITILADTIEQVDDNTLFLVQSSSTPGRRYEVDLLSYTCTCLNFPLIKFCKHICATQTHFPELVRNRLISEPPTDSESLAINTMTTGSSSSESDNAITRQPSPPVPAAIETTDDTPRMADKLERLAARLCRLVTLLPDAVLELEAHLDEALSSTIDMKLLPPSQHIPPNLKGWKETSAAMMPSKKTKRKRAGDPAYGGGQTSGKKVKRVTSTTKVNRCVYIEFDLTIVTYDSPLSLPDLQTRSAENPARAAVLHQTFQPPPGTPANFTPAVPPAIVPLPLPHVTSHPANSPYFHQWQQYYYYSAHRPPPASQNPSSAPQYLPGYTQPHMYTIPRA